MEYPDSTQNRPSVPDIVIFYVFMVNSLCLKYIDLPYHFSEVDNPVTSTTVLEIHFSVLSTDTCQLPCPRQQHVIFYIFMLDIFIARLHFYSIISAASVRHILGQNRSLRGIPICKQVFTRSGLKTANKCEHCNPGILC